MSDSENIYCQYSNPYGIISESAFSHFATFYYRECCLRFRDYLASNRRSNLYEIIDKWLNNETDFDSIWTIPFGMTEAFLIHGKPSPQITAGYLLMRLTELGISGEWHIEMERPENFVWDGFIIENLKNFRVVSDGRTAVIDCRNSGRILTFVKDTERWTTNSAEKLPRLLWENSEIMFYPFKSFDDESCLLSFEAKSSEISLSNCHTALKLISEASPSYLSWVLRVVRAIVPIRNSENRSRSSSSSNLPGLIRASTEINPLELAEIFVHEASHQYFYLLEKFGDVHDGSDDRLYYSPVKRTNRPIRAILLAYHAFANILLFYRDCRLSKVISRKSYEGLENPIIVQIRELEQILLKTTSLTISGNALWRPLAQRLKDF